jgi:Predicted membrane-bound dolichyl-phosphate-mannose-protein mannosyltransferase
MRVVNLNKLGLIIAIIISIIYFYQGYSFISSINSYIGDEVWYPPAAKNILIYVFGDVNIINNGYPYPDENGINNYLNLEHPPLAKYIMALAILIGGYEPIIWRIPSLLLGSFILILAYTIGRKLQGFYCGIIALIIAFFDPMLRTMSYVGMLDIYSAFFALLSFYIMLLKKPELGSLAFGLSIASKETALAEIFHLLIK